MLKGPTSELQEHPTDKQLNSLIEGRDLDSRLVQQLEQHLSHCETCERRASQLLPSELEQKIRRTIDSDQVSPAKLSEGYELVEEAGRGAAGVVYRAIHRGLDRTVALKMLVAGTRASASELARFNREADALSRLNHQNIVKVFDSGEQDGVPFLAMEWIDGKTLGDWLRTSVLSPTIAAEIVASLADGIAHAHRQGILHRDVKPGNVLVETDNFGEFCSEESKNRIAKSLKIVDFGLARFDKDDGFQTQTGETLGTPAYMSPEQIRGLPEHINEATDIYGLGAVLYECLTGRPPFHGNSPHETVQMVVASEPVPVRVLRPSVPRDLAVICHRCLSKKQSDRFPSATELAKDLNRFLCHEPIESRPVSGVERAFKWGRKNPWPVAVFCLLLIATFATIIVQSIHQQRLAGQRDEAISTYQNARMTIWELLDAADQESLFDIPRLQELQLSQTQSAIRLFESLAEKEATPQSQFDLAQVLIRYGTTLIGKGNPDEGSQAIERAQSIFEELIELSPHDTKSLNGLVSSQVKLGYALRDQGKLEPSIAILNSALQIAKRILRQHPENSGNFSQVAWVYHGLANSLQADMQLDEALAAFQAAIVHRQNALDLDPASSESLQSLAESQISLGVCQMGLKMPEAEQSYREAIATLSEILKQNPRNIRAMTSIGAAYLNQSNIFAAQPDLPAAIDACSQGIEMIQSILTVEPDHFDSKYYVSMLYGNRALFEMENNQLEEAINDWRQAVELSVVEETRSFCREKLIRSLVLVPDIDDAIEEATRFSQFKLDAQSRFQLASTWGDILNAVGSQADTESETVFRNRCIHEIKSNLDQLNRDPWFLNNPDAREKILTGNDFRTFRDLCSEFLTDLNLQSPVEK